MTASARSELLPLCYSWGPRKNPNLNRRRPIFENCDRHIATASVQHPRHLTGCHHSHYAAGGVFRLPCNMICSPGSSSSRQNTMRKELTRRPPTSKVGDHVHLRLHRGYRLTTHAPRKVTYQRTNPIKIKRVINNLTYELDLYQP